MTDTTQAGNTAHRWGMVVDLNRCVGCQTCTIACKHANDTVPGVQWRSVLDVETGTFPDVERVFMVVGCQHCAEPPCVPVCPTGATKQRADGLVTMDYELCIGCAACAVGCPYQARTIVHDEEFYYGAETVQEQAVAHDERFGVAQKCTFCVDRVDDGLEAGLVPGVDPDATPACAASCIASAITFGDFNDPDSNVSHLAAEHTFFQMHEELGTDPQIKYLYETPSVPGRTPAHDDAAEEEMSDPANPLVGQQQKFWDMRAAMNFIMGGLGGGFAVMAYLLHLLAGLSAEALVNSYLGAGAVMAVGLFFVWLKIGRKLRAPLVILRPHSSWMSREVYAAGIYYLAVVGDYFLGLPSLHLLAAAAALVFLYCQSKILQASKGIPAWRVTLMPTMLVATGLFEGLGLAALAFAVYTPALDYGYLLPAAGVVLAVVNLALWRRYVSGAKAAGIGPLARGVLARVTPWVNGLGHVLPAVLFLAAMAWPAAPAWLLGLAGILAVGGGACWKSVVIVRAGHTQGFALEKMPQRGSGQFAAPRLARGVV